MVPQRPILRKNFDENGHFSSLYLIKFCIYWCHMQAYTMFNISQYIIRNPVKKR